MTGLSLDIDLNAADLGRLDRAGERLEDTLPLMRAIGGYVRDATRQRFKDQRGPDGAPWKASIRAKLTGGATLVKSTRLRDSIVDAASAKQVQVGTNVVYAPAHQFGIDSEQAVQPHTRLVKQAFGRPLRFGVYQSVGSFSRNPNIPKREFLGIDADDRIEISALVQDFVDQAVAP